MEFHGAVLRPYRLRKNPEPDRIPGAMVVEEQYHQDHGGDEIELDERAWRQLGRSSAPDWMSSGNSQLAREVGVWNLPSYYTCLGRTELCTRQCYDRHSKLKHANWRMIYRSRFCNLELSKDKNFARFLSAVIQRRRWPYVRIHSGGDFYSQAYVGKWFDIIRRNPEVKFLAYTRAFMKLGFEDKPENLTLWGSVDASTPQCSLQRLEQLIFENVFDGRAIMQSKGDPFRSRRSMALCRPSCHNQCSPVTRNRIMEKAIVGCATDPGRFAL